jgi:hypothetical protein
MKTTPKLSANSWDLLSALEVIRSLSIGVESIINITKSTSEPLAITSPPYVPPTSVYQAVFLKAEAYYFLFQRH